jgi:metal transporter CNNM
MMSLDQVTLKLKAQEGSPQERRMAARLLPVVSQHHWLLVSILLGNAVASETLPYVLSLMFSEVTSVVISVTFILFCSEIIPQALLTGPNQLKIASRMIILVKLVCSYSSLSASHWPNSLTSA